MLMVNRRAGGGRRFSLSTEAENPLESLRETFSMRSNWNTRQSDLT